MSSRHIDANSPGRLTDIDGGCTRPHGACCALLLADFLSATARSYQKRKYVWKMLYIYVLGYDVDFGHMEALNLITTQGYAEKTVGYLACVLLLSETNEFLRLVINSVKNDLNSHNEEIQVHMPCCRAQCTRLGALLVIRYSSCCIRTGATGGCTE
jgi:hypothetical protein